MSFLRDVRYALRQIRRQPGLPLVIVLSLGLAMGISTSLFSVVNSWLFTQWPVQRAHEMRMIRPSVTSDEWRYWREHQRTVPALAALGGSSMMRLGSNRTHFELVSSNFFQVLHVPILVGGGFSPSDDAATPAGNKAIISHDLWQNRFAGDPEIIGRTISLDPLNPYDRSGKTLSFTIVGVAGPGFDGIASLRTQIWLPLSAWPRLAPVRTDGSRVALAVTPFMRIASGASEQQAQAELTVLSQRYLTARNVKPSPIVLHTTDRYSQFTPVAPQVLATLTSLLFGITFITLIACGNVSNLLLARGHARRGEIALRLSLGASRGRVIRQLLIESSLLCIAAAVLGVMIAVWLPDAILRAIVNSASSELAGMIRFDFPFDHRVFLWGMAMAVTACVGFGVTPALRATEIGLSNLLKEAHGISKPALMPSLLSYQTIVSVMALAIAGLMLRSAPVREARSIGRSVAGVTAVGVHIPESLGVTDRQRLVAQISEELAAASGQPVAGIAGQIRHGVRQTLRVTPEYFEVLRTPWVAGRAFTRGDSSDGVMIVNEAFARRFWPGQNALGQTLGTSGEQVWDPSLLRREVIGVIGNAQLTNPTAYVPARPDSIQTFLIRAPEAQMRREAPARIARLLPGASVEVMTGQAWISSAFGPASVVAWIVVGFGAAALVLGAIGFFSLLDYAVQHRTREIGIRRALGAHTWDIVRALIEPTTRPLIRGLLIGTAGAIGAAMFMRRADLPSGVNPLDMMTYAYVAAALTLAALLASYSPARRALKIAPAEALRVE